LATFHISVMLLCSTIFRICDYSTYYPLFKFEGTFRKWGGRLIKPFPEWIRFGGSTIFFLVMLDDTLAYLSIIAVGIWTNRQLKKQKELEEKQAKEDKEKGLL